MSFLVFEVSRLTKIILAKSVESNLNIIGFYGTSQGNDTDSKNTCSKMI